MNYQMKLLLNKNTYQRFKEIEQQLQQQKNTLVGPALATVLADLACEVIEQIFRPLMEAQLKMGHRSEHTLEQICQTLRKYLPWSIHALNHQRLVILVDYLRHHLSEQQQQYVISYPVSGGSVAAFQQTYARVQQANPHAIAESFTHLQQLIDQGVTHLLRQPRQLLKFNMVVDKTLDGVTHMTTQQGYKRLDKMGMLLDQQSALDYFDYILTLICVRESV